MWLRKAPRLSVGRIVCIDIGQHNGGIISDISEGGLCFRAVAPVERGETIDFCLSEPGQRIGGKSRVVWTDETQKRGGLSFANLSVHARKQIYSLITEPAITSAAASRGGRLRYGNAAITDSERLASVLPASLRQHAGAKSEHRVVSSHCSMNETENLAFAKHVHTYLREFLRSADQKAAFLLAASTGLLAWLGTGLDMTHFSEPPVKVQLGLTVGATAFLAVSVGFSVASVWPRQHKISGGLVGFKGITEHGESYSNIVVNLTAQTSTEELAQHCMKLSKTLVKKYVLLHWAVRFFVLGGISSIGVLLERLHGMYFLSW